MATNFGQNLQNDLIQHPSILKRIGILQYGYSLLSGGGSMCTFMYTMLLSGLCFYVILGKIKSRIDFSYPGNKEKTTFGSNTP